MAYSSEEERAATIRKLTRSAAITEAIGDDTRLEKSGDGDLGPGGYEGGMLELTTDALRANDRDKYLGDDAKTHMEKAIRADDDPTGRLAKYVTELSDPDYFRAFGAWMRDPVSGGHEWSDRERDAVRRVKWIERAMSLTGAAGGFLVPYALDPAIVLSGVGDVDVMRQVSNVSLTAYNQKDFVTSLGVTPHWYAEAAETSDDAPALLQPTIICRKAAAFVPVSFELFEDSDIVQQIGKVLYDAKRVEEGRVFTLGNGTTEPKASSRRSSLRVAVRSSRPRRTSSPRPTSTPTRPLCRPGGGPTPRG
jgi:HK97 family phage major capsid protein